jgi:DNA adenine methylase
MSCVVALERPKFWSPNKDYVRSKEYVASPFRYPGGKYYALKYILPYITCVPHDEFREPLVGGGNIFFAKSKSRYNWLNDLESDLMDTYLVMADNKLREELISLISKEVANPERHNEIKNFIPQSLLERAFKTYYLNRTSYSGIINKPAWGYQDGKSSPPQNWGNFVKTAGEKLRGIKLTSIDFTEVMKAEKRGETVLMYVDPPYYHADQKRAYTKPFTEDDHYRLENILRETNYFFCLSYDDCKEIRGLYKWAEIYEQSWLYNTANISGRERKLGKELIITNYEVSIPSEKKLFI